MRAQRVLCLVIPILLCIPSAHALPFPRCTYREPPLTAVGHGPFFPAPGKLTIDAMNEMFPQAVEFMDRLYVVWERHNGSANPSIELRAYDGMEWSSVSNLTPRYGSLELYLTSSNVNPRIAAGDEAMYCVWSSNDTAWTAGTDEDIVFRSTGDGETWGDAIEVTSVGNAGMDRLPRVQCFAGRTWFAWETNDANDSSGGDTDIVMRSWDGERFGDVIEVTHAGDSRNDRCVDMAVDDDLMYLTWVGVEPSAYGITIDVWGRVFDGSDWVTPPMLLDRGIARDGGHVAVAGEGGRGYFAWVADSTGRSSDSTSIVLRTWSVEDGLGPVQTVSSRTGHGRNSWPTVLAWDGCVYIAWTTTDDGVSLGSDTDVVYRVGRSDADGGLVLGDSCEVSTPDLDDEDRSPQLVVYRGFVECLWTVDTNYSSFLPDIYGGLLRCWDLVISSIDVTIERTYGCNVSLKPASPSEGETVEAWISLTDYAGTPLDRKHVVVQLRPSMGGPSEVWYSETFDLGDGVYVAGGLAFPEEGTYDVTVLVNGVEVWSSMVAVGPSQGGSLPVLLVALLCLALVSVLMALHSRPRGRD